jgi:hypothetical protein
MGTRVLAGGFPRRDEGEISRRFLGAHVASVAGEIIVEYEAEGLCKGDSGAPLLAATPSGELVVTGVLRGGAPTCRGPDRFVRVDDFAVWLESQKRRWSANR